MDGGIFNNGIQMPVQLQKINEPVDWQQVRIQATIAAMQGLVSNETHLIHANKVAKEKDITTSNFIAKCAIDVADALVAELQKKGGQDDNNH